MHVERLTKPLRIAKEDAGRSLSMRWINTPGDGRIREGTFLGSGNSNDWFCFQKEKKPPEEPSSYRPLCILDTAVKIFERIIHQRIEVAVETLLADNQYGF
ncbi:hypothetical protein EVAR_70150_1 [Eumeta japonica]|uniref:Reverse transcriptase domain-containing protein n=1 Tax=Eumeta variegata TaxID=151549 RepID=A0A4C2A7D7_EUMVA|nr:hypothetical protein EVAR_70150_1 [Eumeta japonica]